MLMILRLFPLCFRVSNDRTKNPVTAATAVGTIPGTETHHPRKKKKLTTLSPSSLITLSLVQQKTLQEERHRKQKTEITGKENDSLGKKGICQRLLVPHDKISDVYSARLEHRGFRVPRTLDTFKGRKKKENTG